MRINFVRTVHLFVFLLIFNSCKDSPSTPEGEVLPNPFGLTTPTNGATSIGVLPTFTWEALNHPDGETVEYSVYLGNESSEFKLLADGLNEATFSLDERLHLEERYSWKVVAKTSNGSETSSNETFWFTTRNISAGKKITDNAEFPPRFRHTVTVFNNQLWVIGGANHNVGPMNDVWKSSDGEHWEQVIENAAFSKRYQHSTVVFKDKLWVIGGNDRTIPEIDPEDRNEVWSTTNGADWELAAEDPGFSYRRSNCVVAFKDKLWMIGGLEIIVRYNDGVKEIEESNFKNDVWTSSDGSSWEMVTDSAAFSTRWSHSCEIFDNKLWVIGGYNEGFFYDTWYSEDGATWIKATDDAGFSANEQQSSVVFDDKIWVFTVNSSVEENYLWYSSDGIEWNELPKELTFAPRHIPGTATFDDKMWIISGHADFSDIWIFD